MAPEQDALVVEHMNLPEKIVKSGKYRTYPDVDELIGEGRLALVIAAKSYDPTEGATFKTWATNKIRWAIETSVRNRERKENLMPQYKKTGPCQNRYDDRPFCLDPFSFRKGFLRFERIEL